MSDIERDVNEAFDPDLDELESLSNEVVGLIENGLLDEAERKCVELEVRFPEQIDWIERSAALHEARGNVDKAVERYRMCLDFVARHADAFDSDSADYYQERIDRLRTTRR